MSNIADHVLKKLRTHLADYCDKYETVKMRREDGILEVRLVTDGGPLRWGRLAHAELEDTFNNIGRDRENQVVILTGTGNEFSGPVPDVNANRKYHHQTADEWGELGWEANKLHSNLCLLYTSDAADE